MNTSIDFSSDSKTCQSKCIIEMQKILEPSVIMEYFEVIRDFHNDDKAATKLKNIILSETSEAVKLLNERASEMILMVDEIFLNRRQRQSSFYRLCHKLARTALPEGTELPDESKCVCFSEENLKKFNVNPGANSSLDFSSNLGSIKGALKQYFGELRCTECGKSMQLCQSGNIMNSMSDCSCSSPSVTSQHKVHEAILELNKAKDNKMNPNSWYFTQLKRDADYYMKRCRSSSTCSDESVNSFEIISRSSQVNYLENDNMDSDSLCSDLDVHDGQLNDCSNKLMEPPQNSEGDFSSAHQPQNTALRSVANIQNLNNKLRHAFSFTANLTDSSKINTDSHCTASDESKAKKVNICEKGVNPAAVLKQSFSAYFNRCNPQASNQSAVRKDLLETTVCPAECLRSKLQKIHIDLESAEFRVKSKAAEANLLHNEREANPSDSLKCALNSYFKNKASENWLRN